MRASAAMLDTSFAPRAAAPVTNFLPMIGVMALTIGMVVFAMWFVFYTIRKRARQSDGAVLPLGFSARWYFRGRQYDGVVRGRAVHIWVLPPKRYVGSLMGVTMSTRTRTHVRLGPRMGLEFVRKLLGREEVDLGPAFAQHVASADDPARLRALVADPSVTATLIRAARGGNVVSFVNVSPGKLESHLTGTLYEELLAGPATLDAYLSDLAATAELLEAAGL